MKLRFSLVPLVLLFLAGGARAAGDSADAGTTRIELTCVNAVPSKVDGFLVVRDPANASAETRVPVSQSAARIAGEAGGSRELELLANGFWMPVRRITARPGETVAIEVWRTAPLRGRFVVAEGEGTMPASFQLGIESPPGPAATRIPADTRIECPIASDGSWMCAVPATTLDVVVRAKTFTPHYQWDVKVDAAKGASLGMVTFRAGASVVVWLDRDTALSLKQPARARLTRLAMPDPSAAGQRLAQPVAQGSFNARGMLQLAPVPAGSYTLEVEAPGFATARVPHIEVYERSESRLRQPIRLEPPIRIVVTVTPPRVPGGGAWTIDLRRADDMTSRYTSTGRGSTDADGRFEASGQAPGRYRIDVADGKGNLYASRDVRMTGDADARASVDLDLKEIRGKVTLGDRLLAASLLFGGRSGAEKIHATSDAEGTYTVALPRGGRWPVDVQARSEDVWATVTLAIAGNDDDVSIRLPDTAVSGWVVGPDGARVGDAKIDLYNESGIVTRRAEADGTFRIRGVAAGAWKIEAADPRTHEQSETRTVAIADGSPLENVEIVLAAVRETSGLVTVQGQPLAGARVTAYAVTGGASRQERAVTDIDGTFRMTFSAAASEALFVVGAAGRTLQVQQLRLASNQPIHVDLAPAGGLLRLELPEGAQRPRVTAQEVVVPVSDMMEWARAQGHPPAGKDVLEIPNIAPGAYRLCAVVAGEEKCKAGTLAAGGTLVLSLREP